MLDRSHCKRFQVLVDGAFVDAEMAQLEEGDAYRTLHPTTLEPLFEGTRTVGECGAPTILSHATGAKPKGFCTGGLQPISERAGDVSCTENPPF